MLGERGGGVVEASIFNLSQKQAVIYLYYGECLEDYRLRISASQYLFRSGSVKPPLRLKGASTVLCVISGNIPALTKCYILFIAEFLY